MSREEEFNAIKEDITSDIKKGMFTAKEFETRVVTCPDIDEFVDELLDDADKVALEYVNNELKRVGLNFRYEGSLHRPDFDEIDAKGPYYEWCFCIIASGIVKEIVKGD